MPSKSAGRIITKINFTKKGVSLFFNKEKVAISKDAFSSSYLYVGKSLTSKEIKELKRVTELNKSMEYAFSLLKKRHYTEWKMREKLYAKEINKSDVDYIIKRLKDVNLLDDTMFVLDRVEYLNEKNYGKNKIIQHLKDEGVFDHQINKIKFPESLEKKKALHQLKSLENKYKREPYEKKKMHIYQTLLTQGFEHEVVNYALNQLSPMNKKDESEKIKKDYLNLKRRLINRYEGKELQDKLFKGLKNKGYHYNDIRKIMEDSYGY